MSQVREVVRDIGEAAPLLASAPPVGRRVIAVIGIDRYVRWPRLHNAVNDARKIEHTFRDLGFEVLAPSLYDDAATHAAIDDLLDTLGHQLTTHDHLVVFFAGHGGTTTRWAGSEPMTTGYLIPVDGTAVDDRPASLFELDSLLSRISRLAALHILVILDACHSGMALTAATTLHRPRGDRGGARDPNPRIHAKTSRVVIASALSDEAAQDGGPLPGHSLFTACLIHALAHDMPRIDLGDGWSGVHGSSLGTFVRDNIYRHQPDTHRQTPDFGRFGNDDRGDMPIALGHASATAAPPAMFPSGSAPVIRTSKIEIDPDPAFASHYELPIADLDEPAPPVRRARPVVIGMVAVAVAAACALAWWRPTAPTPVVAVLDEDDAEIATAPDRATRANDPPPPALPVRAAPSRPLSVIRTAPAAPAVAAAAKCYADVFSIPKGADVFRDNAHLGVAPTRIELPCGIEITLTFRKAEHNPTTKKVVGTHEGARVSTRLPRTTPRPSAQ